MEYNIEVTYKRVKYLRMKVKDGKVLISVPFRTSKQVIEKFVKDNIDFIDKSLAKQQIIKEKRTININDTIVIFNNSYTILPISTKAKLTDHYIFVKENLDINKQIKSLFKKQLLDKLTEITKYYYSIMPLNCTFPKITIKDVKSKWGSYNKVKHEIIYSSELIFKDQSLYNYLVVHELAHILEFNHSSRFYDIVSKYCPNYKVLRKMLKEW